MKKYLFILLLIPGCVTQQRCFEKFPPVTTIEYRDTIVPVYIERTDTVYQWGTIRDTVYASSGTAHAYSYVVHDTLKLFVYQSDSTYIVKLDSMAQVIRETQTLKIKDGKIEGIKNIVKWCVVFAGIVLMIVIVKRIFKRK